MKVIENEKHFKNLMILWAVFGIILMISVSGTLEAKAEIIVLDIAKAETETSGDYEYVSIDSESCRIIRYNGKDKKVIIPEKINDLKVTEIGYGSFSMNNDITSVTIPSCVTDISSNAFYRCKNLTELKLQEGLMSIDSSAFYECEKINNLIIPSSVQTIRSSAFYGCKSITSISIPAGVTTIGMAAFADCGSLNKIVVDKNNKIYDSRNNCNAIIETDTNKMIAACNTSKIPDSILSLGAGVFYGCSGLESITIPSNITSIESPAFGECENLTKIIVDKNNKVYDSRNNCNAIIETATNKLITACNTTKIPEDIVSIGDYAFCGCTALKSMSVPSGITSIGCCAFFKCSNLASITIPSGITSIDEGIFAYCDKLNKVVVDKNNKVYDSRNNCNAIIETTSNKLIAGCNTTKIPSDIETIEDISFGGLNGIKSVIIPSGVNKLGLAFAECKNLISILIPESVEIISSWTLANSGNNERILVMCYEGSKAHDWAVFSGYDIVLIKKTMSGKCGTKATYSLNTETGVMTISGSGDMTDYKYSTRTPWYKYRDAIQKVVIGSGITRIGTNAFYGCNNLTEVTGCANVTSIGINTFRNCPILTKVAGCSKATLVEQYAFCGSNKFATIGSTAGTVNLPACTKIGGYTFYECKGIKKLVTSTPMSYIGTRAFSNCTALASAVIGSGCKTIGSYAFCGNTALTTVTGCAGVAGIGDFAFYGNSKLTSVAGCTKVTNVGKSIFRNCTVLTKVGATADQINFAAAKAVGEYAFSGCKAARYISLGTSLTSIGQYAFQNTSALVSLYIRSSKLTSVGANALKGIKWNAVIYVPSAKVTEYKNGVLKSKGQGTGIVIKKI